MLLLAKQTSPQGNATTDQHARPHTSKQCLKAHVHTHSPVPVPGGVWWYSFSGSLIKAESCLFIIITAVRSRPARLMYLIPQNKEHFHHLVVYHVTPPLATEHYRDYLLMLPQKFQFQIIFYPGIKVALSLFPCRETVHM